MKYLVAIFILFTSPLTSLAHENGASFEVETGDYLVDVGYKPGTIIQNQSVIFDFSLFQHEKRVEFDSLWVRIVESGDVILATALHKSAGKTTLQMRFPRSSKYEMHVQYRDSELNEIAEATINVPIVSDKSIGEGTQKQLVVGAVAVGIPILLAAMFTRTRKRAISQ